MPLIRSQRDREGYVEIDHRESPGLTPEQALAGGRSGVAPFIGAGQVFKAATRSCSHCTRVVIMNPDRTRARGYCPKCDRFVCDWCEAERVRTGVCKPFVQVIDEFLEHVAKGENNGP